MVWNVQESGFGTPFFGEELQRMHRTLLRYIAKELVPSFLLGLLIFTLILFMDKITRIVEMIINKGVSLADVLKLLACLVPNFLLLTLPTAFLLSVMLTFNRIGADNEYTAWKAAGVSLYQFLPPIYLFSLLVFSCAAAMSFWVAPHSLRMFNALLRGIATKHALVGLKERVFFDEFPGLVVYIDRGLPGQETLRGVFIADQNLSEDPVLYFAEEGTFSTDEASGRITAVLRHGCIHRRVSKKETYQILYFDTYTVHLRLDQKLLPQVSRTLKNEELSLAELRAKIREEAAKGKDVTGDRIDFHTRVALPFACFVFCTLGIPLALGGRRTVRYTGFSLSIGVVLLYFVLIKTGWSMTKTGLIPAWLAPWVPNLSLGAGGTYLLVQKAREHPVRVIEWYEEGTARLLDWIKDRLAPGQPFNRRPG